MKNLFYIIILVCSTLAATAQTRRERVDYINMRLKSDPAAISGAGVLWYDNSDSTLKIIAPDGTIDTVSTGTNLWQLTANGIEPVYDTALVVVNGTTTFQVADSIVQHYVETATDTTLYIQTDTLVETIVIRNDGSRSSITHSGDHMDLTTRDPADNTISILHIHGNEGFIFEKDVPAPGTDSIIFQVKTDTREIQYNYNPVANGIVKDAGAGLGLLEFSNVGIGDTIAPGANTATLTNFPAGGTGDPTGFLEIIIGGVTRKIPYW